MKRRVKIIGGGICFGVSLCILKDYFEIKDAIFWKYYCIFAVLFIAGGIGINILYNLYYQRRMQRILHLLEEDCPQEYIVQIEKLLKKAKGENLRNILRLNLAAGYMEARNPEHAIVLLEELSKQQLPSVAVKLTHRINLCECYFQTNRYEKAIQIYRENETLFARFREDRIYGANIAVLDILAKYFEGQIEQATEIMDTAQQKWEAPRFQKVFQEIAACTKDIKGVEKKQE